MLNYSSSKSDNFYQLFLFSILLVIITYGFPLTNFTVSVDNEMPVLSDFGMELGRWGQNLILYHLFQGHIHYFTLFLSLLIFALAAIRLTKLLNFTGYSAYIFCALFLTFPQLSYQVVFSIMAVIAAVGILLSVFAVELFLSYVASETKKAKVVYLVSSALLIMFILSIYQAFILVPASIYIILFFKNTFKENFVFKDEMSKIFVFAAVNVVGLVLYFLSVKIICPVVKDDGYLLSFFVGGADNQFLSFLSLWRNNLLGDAYYGEKTFILCIIMSGALVVKFAIDKHLFLLRFATLILILLMPFIMSAFITSGYHPPRLYLTSNLVFAFLIVFTYNHFNWRSSKIVSVLVGIVVLFNIYFITNLNYTVNKIYKNDRRTAEKIDNIIQVKYPTFATTDKKVYFYGFFPFEYHDSRRLPNSEIFGGSFYTWDNGDNYRLINFFREAGVADYKMIHSINDLNMIKDSVPSMPIWPSYESIKMVNDIIIIKLGNERGDPLYFE